MRKPVATGNRFSMIDCLGNDQSLEEGNKGRWAARSCPEMSPARAHAFSKFDTKRHFENQP
jgi:hypothetical protein